MSMSSAMSNALSGISAATRGTEVVSSNIANRNVPGYARREVELSSRVYTGNGGGVSIDGVQRNVSQGLLAENRLALSSSAASNMMTTFHASMENVIGTANDDFAISSLLAGFDAALISAAARPDQEIRLNKVVDAASALAKKINSVAESVQQARSDADRSIASDVTKLNEGLGRIAKLNVQIISTSARGADTSSLEDARQAAIDELSSIVPMKVIERENGRVALYTQKGGMLLDGPKPSVFAFEPTSLVTPELNIADGSLGGLSVDGKPLTAFQADTFNGGSLGSAFAIRDVIAPQYQVQIDAFAREAYDRMASADATVGPNEPGIFADGQSALAAGNEHGFANRITINAAIDPNSGGQSWRVRAGIGATQAGNTGESSLLTQFSAALSDKRAPISGGLASIGGSMLTYAADLSSIAASKRLRAEASSTQEGIRQKSLAQSLLGEGVDADREMETLLSLERAYAANARVFQTANDMIDQILRLT